jgi:hypothetical protein
VVRVTETPESAAMPMIPAEALVEERTSRDSAPQPPDRLVTISAVNADVRPLLIGLARENGIDLVVTSDVNRRVSVNLKDVTAMEAIVAIASAADLAIALPRQRELPAVVYYQLPVDVNKESAATIAARFGVSLELARFLVEARGPRN